MKTYTIVVTIVAESQERAFRFVEAAIENSLEEGNFDAKGISSDDGTINVSTPDGTRSVVL